MGGGPDIDERLAELAQGLRRARRGLSRIDRAIRDRPRLDPRTLFPEVAAAPPVEPDRTRPPAPAPPVDDGALTALQARVQHQLLELERLRDAERSLKAAVEEWRGRARALEKERTELRTRLEQSNSSASRLDQTGQAQEKRIRELEAELAEQARELAVAERRAQHLRRHLNGTGT
jgi:hypothetical protein